MEENNEIQDFLNNIDNMIAFGSTSKIEVVFTDFNKYTMVLKYLHSIAFVFTGEFEDNRYIGDVSFFRMGTIVTFKFVEYGK